MWHDPWLEGSSVIRTLGHHIISVTESNNAALVKDFLSGNSCNVTSSNHVLMIEIKHLLQTVQVGLRDKITGDTLHNIKIYDIWESIQTRHVYVPWHNLVWHKMQIPKAGFMMWLVMKGRLLIRDSVIAKIW